MFRECLLKLLNSLCTADGRFFCVVRKFQKTSILVTGVKTNQRCWAISFMISILLISQGFAASSDDYDSLDAGTFDIYQGAIPIKEYSFEVNEDLDYNRQPDDWVRRKGVEFRKYVLSEIDYAHADAGKRSLRIDANGSGAVYYSPALRIDSKHSYVMQASVLTQGMKFDAAVVSFSFLNHRKQRVRRIVTAPVSGTHKQWVRLNLPPFVPDPQVKYVVVGCHIIHSENMDISGSAWFDNISIGKLPRLSLASNFETHFRQARSKVTIRSSATGLDRSLGKEPYQYELRLHSEDVNGKILDKTTYQFSTKQDQDKPDETSWDLKVYPPGYYRVRASLWRNGEIIVRKRTSFAVLNLVGEAPVKGEFGWNLSGGRSRIPNSDLLAITRESGINWVKTPVWRDAFSLHSSESGHLLTGLRNQSIIPIGMLVNPPDKIRKKYAEQWTGISELFTSPPIVWRQDVNQVMALYSPTVTRWQLGNDQDSSFVGMPGFNDTMEQIRKELQRIGQIRQLGVRWNVGSAIDSKRSLNRNFLSIVFDETQTIESITKSVQEIHAANYEAWIIVKADKTSEDSDPDKRANSLVKRLIDAKRCGADLIFSYAVFDKQYGLLKPDGSPSELFLPWRSIALALNGSEYAGSIQLPNNSVNHVFLRGEDAVMVIWNKDSTEEEIYLGDEVILKTIWGDESRLMGSPENGRQTIKVSDVPQILTGCSRELALWRMGVHFEKGRIASSSAEHEDNIIIRNSFPWNIHGKVHVKPAEGWQIQPREFPISAATNAEVSLPISIKLPSQTGVGEQMLSIEFDLGGAGVNYPFRVYRNYLVGLGDVHMAVQLTKLENGGLLVEQVITNKTNPPESLDLRCHLLIRGRRRQTRNKDGVLSGQTAKNIYLIPNYDQLKEKDIWLRAVQKNGQRSLNEILNEDQINKILEKKKEIEEKQKEIKKETEKLTKKPLPYILSGHQKAKQKRVIRR